jgi:hypothetical protein
MVAERLAAWGSLTALDPELNGIFVTSSEQALAEILDDRAEVVTVGTWRHPPSPDAVGSSDRPVPLEQQFEKLATSAWPIDLPDVDALPPTEAKAQATLTVYLVPQATPSELWAAGGGLPQAPAGTEAGGPKACRNTVVALVAW